MNVDPIALYTNNAVPTETEFRYWLEEKTQNIQIIGSKLTQVELTKDDLNNAKKYSLPAGENIITIPKGYVRVSNGIFALSKNDWFRLYKLDLVSNSNYDSDYKLVIDNYNYVSQVKEITINVK